MYKRKRTLHEQAIAKIMYNLADPVVQIFEKLLIRLRFISRIQERNSNHYHHNPYQYVHVQHPGIFEWGYNRGNHEGHSRSQVLKQKHHNHFQSEVNYLICFLKSCSISVHLNGNKWDRSKWNLNGN